MTKNTIVVQFYDGRSADGATLRRELSADIFQRKMHYDLAGAFAQAIGASPDIEAVLHNLLTLKSLPLRDISAALFIIEADPGAVQAVQVAPNLAPVISQFAAQVQILKNPKLSSELISRKTALMTAAKAVVHRLYRLGRKPYIAGTPVVRAWVDLTLRMYAHEVKSAQVRVFPFPLNRNRQKKFVAELKRQKINWTRDGLPYRIFSIISLIVAGESRRPFAIAKFEHDAFTKYASEIARSGAGPVYTSDEFEVGAIATGQALKLSGTDYVNSAHGVGMYCPRTAYSHFRFLTNSQRDFYIRSAPQTQFERRKTQNFCITTSSPSGHYRKSVVFVHQDFRSAGLLAESHVEMEIIRILDEINLPSDVSKYIKIHPNADPSAVSKLTKKTQLIKKWEDIGPGKKLFLIINSTAFYDLSGVGDIFVFKDRSFNPDIYLEGEYRYFDLQTLEPTIEGWMKAAE